MFVSHLYVFFGECLFRSFSHFLIGVFVFLVLSCMSCLYILEINPWSVVSFPIIFSHSEGCLFTLLIVASAVPKLSGPTCLLLLLSRFSCVQLCATLWTVAHQAPLPTGFSRHEYWSGLPFPSLPTCLLLFSFPLL